MAVLRNSLKSSVLALLVLAVVSFAMIFVISLTLINSLNDLIRGYTPLAVDNMGRWASIPGDLKYTYNKSVYLFSIQDIDSSSGTMDVKSVGPLDYSVKRNFTNPTYDNYRKVINYTMEYDYTLTNTQHTNIEETPIRQVNLDGESVWFQMNYQRPTFQKSWQAVTLASSTMLASEMLSTLYAY